MSLSGTTGTARSCRICSEKEAPPRVKLEKKEVRKGGARRHEMQKSSWGVGGTAHPDFCIQPLIFGVGERREEGIHAIVFHFICRRGNGREWRGEVRCKKTWLVVESGGKRRLRVAINGLFFHPDSGMDCL